MRRRADAHGRVPPDDRGMTAHRSSLLVLPLLAGALADLVSIPAAIYAVAALTALSGLIVTVRMYETHPR